MTDESRKPLYNDPDADNSEQDEEGTQAQDVTEDALAAQTDLAEDSEPGGPVDPTRPGVRAPDLVDEMNRMNRTGAIDMEAFAGEEDMDDEEGSVPTGE